MRTPGLTVNSWTLTKDRRWHGGRGDADDNQPTAIAADRLIDGSGAPPIERALVRVSDGKITYCGPADEDPERGSGPIVDLGDRTLMPGLIDCHAHPGFFPQPSHDGPARSWSGQTRGTSGPSADRRAQAGPMQSWLGERRLLEAASAAWRALVSGVTTMRITGLNGKSSYALQDAVARGVFQGPRLIVAGPIICPTGGHGHMSSGENADGPVEVRRAARQRFMDGADFLKLTATGGGTPGTVRSRGTFTVEELSAAAQEAEQHNSYATAHVHGTEGIVRCLDAGIQMIEHGTFVSNEDGLEHFDRSVAERIRDQNVPVVPTVQVNGRVAESEDLDRYLAGLDPAEQAQWTRRLESVKRRVELVGQLHEVGVVILMGSDGGGRPAAIDDLAYGLELHVRAGVDPKDVILSATSVAADWIGVGDVTGSLEVGKSADVIACPGDPWRDITRVAQTDFVMAGGDLIRQPEELVPGG